MSTTIITPGPSAPESGGIRPSVAPEQSHDRRRWIFLGAGALVVVLAVVGWLVWRNWVPSAPGSPRAGTPSATSVELAWTASTDGPDVDQYLVLRDAAQVGAVGAGVTTYTAQALTPDTTYRFTVVAASGSKRSDPSAEVVVRTMPAKPDGLNATLTQATAISISWWEPKQGPVPEKWVVLRDGIEVGTMPGSETSFDDSDLAFGTTYRYQVVAQSGANRSEPSDELAAMTLPATPSGLRLTARTASAVTLGWTYPSGPTPERFTISRDGDEVGSVAGRLRTFQDTGLRPGTTYGYTVVAVSGRYESTASAVVKATTLTPSVADGRLAGSFDVDGRITKAAGLTIGDAAAAGQTFGASWTLTPKCSSGACDATLTGRLVGHTFTMTLKRSGAVYTGSNKAHVSHCTTPLGTTDVMNSLTVRLTVTKAGLDSDDSWTAKVVGGSLTMTSPYTAGGSSGALSYYCPGGSLSASLTGTAW